MERWNPGNWHLESLAFLYPPSELSFLHISYLQSMWNTRILQSGIWRMSPSSYPPSRVTFCKLRVAENIWRVARTLQKTEKNLESDPVRNLSNQKHGELIDSISCGRLKKVLEQNSLKEFWLRAVGKQLFSSSWFSLVRQGGSHFTCQNYFLGRWRKKLQTVTLGDSTVRSCQSSILTIWGPCEILQPANWHLRSVAFSPYTPLKRPHSEHSCFSSIFPACSPCEILQPCKLASGECHLPPTRFLEDPSTRSCLPSMFPVWGPCKILEPCKLASGECRLPFYPPSKRPYSSLLSFLNMSYL